MLQWPTTKNSKCCHVKLIELSPRSLLFRPTLTNLRRKSTLIYRRSNGESDCRRSWTAFKNSWTKRITLGESIRALNGHESLNSFVWSQADLLKNAVCVCFSHRSLKCQFDSVSCFTIVAVVWHTVTCTDADAVERDTAGEIPHQVHAYRLDTNAGYQSRLPI